MSNNSAFFAGAASFDQYPNIYVTVADETIPANTQVIYDDYLELAASFEYELSSGAVLVVGDFASPLPLPDQNTNIFVTVNDELVPSNSEVIFSDFYELSAPFTTEVASSGLLQIGTSSPVPVYPPGYQLDYVELQTVTTVTATSEGTAQTWIDGNTIFFDGATRVKIEGWADSVGMISGTAVAVLLDGSTALGWLCEISGAGGVNVNSMFYGARFITPSAGLHQYHIKWWKTAGTLAISADVGGAGKDMPAWYRITVA